MYLGVDLGTTTSQVAAYYNGNAIELNERGDYGIPSVFYYDHEVDELVGTEALSEAKINGENIVRNVKMQMGQKFILDSKEYTAEEIIKRIYKEALELGKRVGDQYFKFSIDGIVISHPAQFTMSQVNTLCDLARNCLDGEKPVTIIGTIKEPVAAALTYYNDKDVKIPEGSGVLVYDLGGGTCDIALVCKDKSELSEYKVIDSTMLEIGGRNWDEILVEYVSQNIREKYEDGDEILQNYKNKNALLEEVQRTKISLSKKLSARFKIDVELPNGKHAMYFEEITRATFEQITKNLLDETLNKLEEIYRRHKDSIDIREIVLVGGSSNMPQVKDNIQKLFSDIVVRIYHSQTAVVLGTAIYADKVMAKIKELGINIHEFDSNDSLDEVIRRPANILLAQDAGIVSDVLPFSYGIRCMRGNSSKDYYVKNLLIKGSSLPVSFSDSGFKASSNSSTSVQIDIYESDCADRIYLCNSGKNETHVATIFLDTPNGIFKDDIVSCEFTITSLDMIEVKAHDFKGDVLNTRVKITNKIANQ